MPMFDRKSFPQLKKALFEKWDQISEEVINNLIESMPNRLEEVIKANGGNTKY